MKNLTKLIGLIAVFAFVLVFSNQAFATDVNELQPAVPGELVIYNEAIHINGPNTLYVGGPAYFPAGIHVGANTTGGVTYFNGTIVNNTSHTYDGVGIPVTIGDDLRVDGEIWRGTSKGTSDNMPVKFSDSVVPTLTGVNTLGDSDLHWSEVWTDKLQGENVITEENLNSTNDPAAGNVLVYAGDGQFRWAGGEDTGGGSGGEGELLPSGTEGQTLYNDGTNWLATSQILHNGANIEFAGGYDDPTDEGATIYSNGTIMTNHGLTADGAVRAGLFEYNDYQTRYWSVNGYNLYPASESTTYNKVVTPKVYLEDVGTDGVMSAVMNIPHGARLLNIKIEAVDNDAAEDFEVILRRFEELDTTGEDVGEVSTSGDDTGWRLFNDDFHSSSSWIVDNEAYTYIVYTHDMDDSTEFQLGNITITYQVNEPLP